jgi:hypothetical protein
LRGSQAGPLGDCSHLVPVPATPGPGFVAAEIHRRSGNAGLNESAADHGNDYGSRITVDHGNACAEGGGTKDCERDPDVKHGIASLNKTQSLIILHYVSGIQASLCHLPFFKGQCNQRKRQAQVAERRPDRTAPCVALPGIAAD